MKTVHVTASNEYDVLIGEGLLNTLGIYTARVCSGKICIVSDSNVWPLYGCAAQASLESAGLKTTHFVFPAGEASKNGSTYLELLNFLAEGELTRSDAIVALGGGVVGDLAGFAAATYLRGIRYIQVPTTLLAAVDSSVGGKTAIDLTAGKNLAGAFWQPCLVICDTSCLQTLPEEIYRDGCAEVIKYGVLYDPALLDSLATSGPDFDPEEVIARCVAHKRDVVAQDEYDTGSRMKLNLGHTIGHGIEAQSNFTISHGKAVAAGMAIAARASASLGICSRETAARIVDILVRFDLPVSSVFSAESLYTSSLSDKKRSGGQVRLILPRAIGDCIIHSVPVTQIQSFIEAGL